MKILNVLPVIQIALYSLTICILYIFRSSSLSNVHWALLLTIGAFLSLSAINIGLIIFAIASKRMAHFANGKTPFLFGLVILLVALYLPVLSWITGQSVFSA